MLSTAHACKFPDVFEELGIKYDIPSSVDELYHKERKQKAMTKSFEDFKAHLLGAE
jgi:threonine synthase